MQGKIIKITKNIIINSLVLLVLLEVFGFVIIKYFHVGMPPNAYLYQNQPIVSDRNQTFGVWHKPNSQTTTTGPCWSVQYAFNSAGARDTQRTINANKSRFLLIGDSFFEGYGVRHEDQFQQILEQKTHTEFMSFASSGNFGLTQMQLMYDTLASKYEHNYLIISFFPFNDFNDDNYEYCKTNATYNNRYRPYYTKNQNNTYSLKYLTTKLEDSEWYYKNYKQKTKTDNFKEIINGEQSIFGKINTINKNFSFGRAIVSHLIKTLAGAKYQKQNKIKSEVFEKINQEEIEKYFYVLNKIKTKTKSKKIILLTIAHPLDYINYQQTKSNKLGVLINNYCTTNNIKTIDLLEELKTYPNLPELSLPCDGHWSAKGHQVVADILQKKLTDWGYLIK
jgi:lysophospholipase L1-like esterase